MGDAVAYICAAHPENNVLSDVGGMIGNALQISGDYESV
jgi:hypothetical protein